MQTEHIVALLIAERDRLSLAVNRGSNPCRRATRSSSESLSPLVHSKLLGAAKFAGPQASPSQRIEQHCQPNGAERGRILRLVFLPSPLFNSFQTIVGVQ